MVGEINASVDLFEVETIGGGISVGLLRREEASAKQGCDRDDTERAAHHRAAAVAPQDHVADGLAPGGAAGNVVMGLAGGGPVAEWVVFRHIQDW
jgi:hypothetical protein